MRCLDITAEPKGEIYGGLLDLALATCATFSLVWRDQLTFERSAEDLATELSPFLVHEERTDRWPGTILTTTKATVRHYRLTQASRGVLQRPSALYAWRAPALPEDLAFYKPDGAVWLASISHEGNAWFEVEPEFAVQIRQRVPGLKATARAQ